MPRLLLSSHGAEGGKHEGRLGQGVKIRHTGERTESMLHQERREPG